MRRQSWHASWTVRQPDHRLARLVSRRYVDSGADCRLRLRTFILFVGLGGMANSFMMFCSTEYVLCYLLNNRAMSKQIVLYGEGHICHYLIEMCNYSGQKVFAKSWKIDTVAKAIENQDRTPIYLAAVWNTSAANTPQNLHIRTPEDLETNKKSR